jgi:hypothetical protein
MGMRDTIHLVAIILAFLFLLLACGLLDGLDETGLKMVEAFFFSTWKERP